MELSQQIQFDRLAPDQAQKAYSRKNVKCKRQHIFFHIFWIPEKRFACNTSQKHLVSSTLIQCLVFTPKPGLKLLVVNGIVQGVRRKDYKQPGGSRTLSTSYLGRT